MVDYFGALFLIITLSDKISGFEKLSLDSSLENEPFFGLLEIVLTRDASRLKSILSLKRELFLYFIGKESILTGRV